MSRTVASFVVQESKTPSPRLHRMNLTDADIGEFQVLWKQGTKHDLPPETARDYAESLIRLVALTWRIEREYRKRDPPRTE
ncbi:MAG: hypothetical protein V1784_10720 [bacterium]